MSKLTGGTVVEEGQLLVDNEQGGSGTGSGTVQVNSGTLGGAGQISGPVSVGDATGRIAFLSPTGVSGAATGTLTILDRLTFNSDGNYEVAFDSDHATIDQVVAHGVMINGARFAFSDIGGHNLQPGTVLTVIKNTSRTPIVGAFTNLPEGSIFRSGVNRFEVSYHGGSGNDLILTELHR
jgi:hypothetical protein